MSRRRTGQVEPLHDGVLAVGDVQPHPAAIVHSYGGEGGRVAKAVAGRQSRRRAPSRADHQAIPETANHAHTPVRIRSFPIP